MTSETTYFSPATMRRATSASVSEQAHTPGELDLEPTWEAGS
jgi:hypothetical protein